MTNLTDLNGKIPNVTLEAVATFPNASAFSIRGLAFGDVESTFEPTVGVEVNGVYLACNVGATQDFFDIDSIEVQRLNATIHLDETVVANAGAASYMGVEVESHAILGGGFSLDASVGYLDAHFDSFTANLNGACSPGEDPYFCCANDYRKAPLASAPRWSLSLIGNYRHGFSFAEFNANVSATYTSSQYTSLSPINTVADFSLRPANTILNTTLRLATPDEKYRIALWVKNLTAQHVLYERFAVGPLSAPESYSPPLTWGVSLSGRF